MLTPGPSERRKCVLRGRVSLCLGQRTNWSTHGLISDFDESMNNCQHGVGHTKPFAPVGNLVQTHVAFRVIIDLLAHLLEGPSRSLDIQCLIFGFAKYLGEVFWKESAQ